MSITILICKPKAVSQKDRRTLAAKGVVVVETDSPESFRLVSPTPQFEPGEMLVLAAKTIKQDRAREQEFGAYICNLIMSKGAQ